MFLCFLFIRLQDGLKQLACQSASLSLWGKKSNSGRREIGLLESCSPSWGKPRQDLKAEPAAEATEARCILAFHPQLAWLVFLYNPRPPACSLNYPWWSGPTISITGQENVPQTCPQVGLMETISQMRPRFPPLVMVQVCSKSAKANHQITFYFQPISVSICVDIDVL